MRKWMRERLKRRNKTAGPEKPANAPVPLQPKYFDAEPGDAPAESRASAPEPEVEADIASGVPEPPMEGEPVESAPAGETTAEPASAEGAQRRPARRRRGRRGRKGASAASPVQQDEKEAESEKPEPNDRGAIAPSEPAPMPVAAPPVAARASKGTVVLAIGLPGSGKTTWFKRHEIRPLSSDMMRTLLFDDVREQRFQDLVFSNLRSMLKARLIARRPMNYVDATNLTPQERHHWIKLAKDFHYEVHALYFDVPLEVCIERHQRRDRVVPEDVMRRMAAKLKAPTFAEGFGKITVVRVKKKDEAPTESGAAESGATDEES
jgi:predicted kinase